ncbi:peptidase inhibitor 16 [Caerostris darwini]|uniref:Peptidase inhibitor 16 n=1 Tax=Caerostris darwini TaxID=1538125 RepID=A0AAV4RH01_9ARAC|nr:peptidase inhibitor 16 [Caerostris darwini]
MEKYCTVATFLCLSVGCLPLIHGLTALDSNAEFNVEDDSVTSTDGILPFSEDPKNGDNEDPQSSIDENLLLFESVGNLSFSEINGQQHDMPFEELVQLDSDEQKKNILISEPVVDKLPDGIDWLAQFSKKRHIPDRGFDNETKKMLLDLHNLYRSNVTPPAGNMNFMEWDDRLEHLAQLWSDNCEFRHGRPPGTSYPLGLYGQNLYIGPDPSGYKALWMWYEEYVHYNLRTEYCKPEEQCGHFVQMAWGESRLLGCGMRRCPSGFLISCHYYPPAFKGTPMYIVARPCSQCSGRNGTLCSNNLCVSQDQCQRNTEFCKDAKCNLKCQNCGRLNKTTCQCTCADGWDSLDCSATCQDAHERCGVNPGFPTKSSCSMNKYAVANTYCRKMCGTCNAYSEEAKVNHICCDGKPCKTGYVLDLKRKPCRCTMLCPGPLCDILEDSGSGLEYYFLYTIMQILIFYSLNIINSSI